VQRCLLELNAVSRCMDYMREGVCAGRDQLLVMLLANLTALEAGAEALLQVGRGPVEGLHVAQLLKLFLTPPPPATPGAAEGEARWFSLLPPWLGPVSAALPYDCALPSIWPGAPA